MSTNIISSGGVPDSTYGSPRRQHPDEAGVQPAAAPAQAASMALFEAGDLTLVIEPDEAGGEPIYKTIDRRTGAVIRRFSRAELLQFGETAGYAAGAVLRTRA